MIPNNELSTQAYFSGWREPVRQPLELLADYEIAGVALLDGSQGMLVQQWSGRMRKELISSDPDVYNYHVEVSAPNTPWTLLFTRTTEITEIAIAFDNNMHPFVAFTEVSGDVYIWWFDPIANAQVFTLMPSGVKTPRACVDDKRPQSQSISDIVLSYIRAGNLCVRYQRERYQTEHILKTGLGSDAELICAQMGRNWRMQWRFRGFAGDGQTFYSADPVLADVVMDLCLKAGIPRFNVNVDELYEDFLPGMKVQIDEGFEKPLEWLRDMYFFDKALYDKVLHFPKRGREPVAWIPYEDLVAGRPTTLDQTRADETKLPLLINLQHIDPDAGYAKNKQTASRRSNRINAKAKKTIESGLVLNRDHAATVCLIKLKVEWNETVTYKFKTTLKYTHLTVTDVVMVEDARGTWHRVRLEDRDEDRKILEWTARQDAGTRTYKTTGQTGVILDPPVSTTPGELGETRLEIINVSGQRDQDDELGLYIAACGENSAWTGYTLLYSIDNGTSYVEAYVSQSAATIGDTLTNLLDESPEYPSSQTVEVLVNFALSSISQDQLLARQNRAIIGDEEIQFTTATLLGMVGTKYHYRLSGLVRGKFNTEINTWPADTRFVLLDTAVNFVQLQRTFIGLDLMYKPVTIGLTVDDTVATAYLFDDPQSQKEWPVTTVTASRDGSDNVTVSWVGRARFGVDGNPYHSKYMTGYRVKFSNGHTIDVGPTVQTAVYNSAPVGVTVQVCAVNEITGEGPLSTALAT